MKDFINKPVIFWDFDGVILDSMPVREYGFKKVLKSYPSEEVEKLLFYHNANGGLSRYVKFRYFFEEIRGEILSEKKLQVYAKAYSKIMKEQLLNRELIYSETLDFIKTYYKDKKMFIVSGSEEKELNYLCKSLKINGFFEEIKGSPTPKIRLVERLLKKYKISNTESCLVGDSINDYQAAEANNIDFYGFNNPSLLEKGKAYIHSFNEIA